MPWLIDTDVLVEGERGNPRFLPSLADGILATTALRLGASVATRNLKDFEAMSVDCEDPLA